jgi:GNAT superfamily N-acetyltransferase
MENVIVEKYTSDYHQQVVDLILHIQRDEFGVPITIADQPDLNSIETFYQRGNGNFWIARQNSKVVGTIALIDIGNQELALRKMFVDSSYRGKPYNVGQALLDKVFEWMIENNCVAVYLGTLERFVAARKFYEKNGFTKINIEELPKSFPRMKLDTTFYKKEMSNDVAIVSYRPEYQPWFEKLNREWIEKYFWMEPIDFEVLQHPDIHILGQGGSILFAKVGNQIGGTVALKFVSPGVYEFTKMAVDEKFRGKKIGLALGNAAVAKAKQLGATKIILYSNRILAPAISLYGKMGFVEVPVDAVYKRSDIKMELLLTSEKDLVAKQTISS